MFFVQHPGLRAWWKTQENFCTAFPGFDLGNGSFPRHRYSKQQLLWCPCQRQGEKKLGVLSAEGISLASCTLVPEHRQPQGVWRQPPLQRIAENSFTSRAQCAEGPRATNLSHLPKVSCNENKWLPIKAVRSLGNNENKHKTAKGPFSGCVSLLPMVILSPVSPRTGSTWPQQSAARCCWHHRELSAKGPY